ncbi:MAG TPA: cyanophycinase [Terriglobales bacterium]|nr:cyanophycinase [Terriglobales bacterium]
MSRSIMKLRWVVPLILSAAPFALAQTPSYKYIRIGSPTDVTTKATAGYALMGGGDDLDEAFKFLCEKTGGGDFLVLRASGNDEYNDYINKLCKANSVATMIITDRDSASDPKVAGIIRHAEAVFIAGGDQAHYINWWMGTPVQDALNAHIAAGKPIGGTSAGLAVLGQYIYSAQGDAPDDEDLQSAQTLVNPYMPRVTVRRDFLKIDLLANILTDTHFAKRDRMGRTLTFLARIMKDGWSPGPREIAVDEKSAVLIERTGKARVIGSGKGAYFLSTRGGPEVCRENMPLTFRDITVYRGPTGSEFNLREWRGKGGATYSLSVVEGKIQSMQKNGEVY